MLQAPTCGQCGRFSLPADARLSAHGFGRCAWLREWQYRSGTSPCTFNPPRFEAKA